MSIRIACLTMMKDEPFFLKIWHDYYAGQVGSENLFVIDHASEWKSGKTSEIDAILAAVSIIRIPFVKGSGPLALRGFDFTRFQMIASIVSGLRAYYDVVLYNDIDEITVPDPRKWGGLREYLTHLQPCGSVMAGVGLEIFQDVENEPEYSHHIPLFAQRRNYVYSLHYSKPNVFFVNCRTLPHKSYQPFTLAPDLCHFHLKYLDKREIVSRQSAYIEYREQGLGADNSRWRWSTTRLEAEFEALARRPLDTSREFPHHSIFAQDLPNAPGGYAIDVQGEDRRFWVCNSLDQKSIAALDGSRYELPERFSALTF